VVAVSIAPGWLVLARSDRLEFVDLVEADCRMFVNPEVARVSPMPSNSARMHRHRVGVGYARGRCWRVVVAMGKSSPKAGASIGRRDNRCSWSAQMGISPGPDCQSDHFRAPRPTVPRTVTIRFVYPTATVYSESAA
jgi:hypothetical protein